MKKLRELKEKIANNKILRIISFIIKFIIYSFLILLLLTIIVQKISQNNKTIGGFMIFTVASESMKGEYEVGDIIISKSVPENEIKIGDNVTYLGKEGAVNGLVITHKVIEIEETSNGKVFTTKGIVNIIPDPPITYDQIYGKVIHKTTILSYVSSLIRNRIVYYVSFIVIGLLVSIELVSAIFEGRKEDDADE